MSADRGLYDVGCVLVLVGLVVLALCLLVSALRRSRPLLDIGMPVAVGLACRLFAVAVVSTAGFASLRGGDESLFLSQARDAAAQGIGSGAFWHSVTSSLHVALFSVEISVLRPPAFGMRVVQVGLGLAGICLLVAAVYDVAGARAARLVAWVLALDPTTMFFTTLLHKEAVLFLADGLLALGAARMWGRRDAGAIVLMALGSLIVLATRSYAGWFVLAACAALTFHAAVRRSGTRRRRSAVLAMSVLVAALAAMPVVLRASSSSSPTLQRLNVSQRANATDNSNLRLEQTDFSSRTKIIANLPGRTVDVVLRPYPWQIANTAQRFGVIGTLLFWLACSLLIVLAVAHPERVFARAGPFLYLGAFTLLAYSLSAGNAGTSFRYRTHVLLFAVAGVAALLRPRAEPREARARSRPAPAFAPWARPGAPGAEVVVGGRRRQLGRPMDLTEV